MQMVNDKGYVKDADDLLELSDELKDEAEVLLQAITGEFIRKYTETK